MKIISCFIGSLLFFCLNSSAQQGKNVSDCIQLLGKSFVSDGQDHQLIINGVKYTKLNLLFYPQFRYKVIACSNLNSKVEMRLTDNNGIVCYSNANNQFSNQWEFVFSNPMNATIEIRLLDSSLKEESIRLIVGYKSIVTNP